jgi:hypothetical protein
MKACGDGSCSMVVNGLLGGTEYVCYQVYELSRQDGNLSYNTLAFTMYT